MAELSVLLEQVSEMHRHLCPRQVLGVRMGMLAGELLGLAFPQVDKRAYAFVETDGCFADGVSVATGCTLGHRTMRLMDYGKVAVTVADTQTGHAWRIAPHPQARHTATARAPLAQSPWHAMLQAYQDMPPEDLLCWTRVALTVDLAALISRPGVRVHCAMCGEEILNEREVMRDDAPLCRACAGDSCYFVSLEQSLTIPTSKHR
jgi:formylmethanofuran dehydrogenase subunit E